MIVVPHDQNNVYHYSKSSGSKNNEYFTCMGCTRSKSTVKGAAILEDGNLWVGPDHGCVPVTMENHLKEQEDRKCRLMVAEGVKPRTAHDIFFKRTADMDIDIGEYNKYRRQYSRWRGAYYPSCFAGKIAPEFHYLYPPQKGKRWLLFEDKQVTGFASDLQLRIMAEADVLQLDASFGNAPVGYSQYLSIHALVGENGQEWQPVFMAVMDGKKEDLYDRIFDEIKKYWEENDITPTFKRILSDYESSLQNALIKFTDPEKVWGCSFHYSQALLRSVGRLHLMNYYSVFEKRDYPEKWLPIRTWIRSIMALPLLPIDERDFIWEKVLRNPPAAPEAEQTWPVQEMQSFVEYVENTWFTKPGNSWCFFNGGRVKNTNRSEGWHSVIAKLYDRKPKYNVFIHDMQLLFSKAEKRLEALKRGEKAREQEKKYKILVDRIQAYEDELVESLQSVI
uniref:MULE transposase domain-containing protein n=1 Tax=Panagrolaimus davidi TaxID=227884 RepID=A0A914Q2L7_9BILA